MPLQKPHAPVRAVLACALHDDRFRGTFVSLETAKTICNALSPGDYIATDASLCNAFKGSGESLDLELQLILKDDDANLLGCSESAVLAIRKGRRGIEERLTVIGCFDSPDNIAHGDDIVVSAVDADIQRHSFRGGNQLNIPSSTLHTFHQYAKSRFVKTTDDVPQLNQPKQKKRRHESPRPAPDNETRQAQQRDDEIKQLKASLNTNCAQIRDLAAANARMQQRLNELNVIEIAKPKTVPMVYTLPDMKSGTIQVDLDRGVVLCSELERGVVSDEQRNGAAVKMQRSDENGEETLVLDERSNVWVPKRGTVVDKCHLTTIKSLAKSAKAFRCLFEKGRTAFPDRAKDIIAASSMAAAGASDWGVQSVIFGTLKAVAEVMDMDLTHQQLADGCPDVTTLKNWEFNLAGGCLAKAIHEISQDAERLKEHDMTLQLCLMTDHGNREGIDHLVKVIIWASIDADGNRVIRHFNLDIDKGGHSTEAAADAIELSLQSLMLDGLDVEISFIVGDAGGGAAVHQLKPALVKRGVMPEFSDYVNCLLHALNLSYQTACIDSMGDQGMGKNTPFQLCFLAILLLKTIKKQGGLDLLKKYYAMTMTQLLEDETWQENMSCNFVQAFGDLMDEIDESGDSITEHIDEMLKDCPTNIAQGNFGRWGTISKVAHLVLRHSLALLNMAYSVKDVEKKGCYLHTVASELIKLMSSKATMRRHDTPTHYAHLQWIVGFGDAMFDANMEWAKRNDPVFGPGSYGQISRLIPEHLFVMEKQLQKIRNGGWKTLPEFGGYIEAMEGVPSKGPVENKGREYFEKLPSLFLERFEETFTRHTCKWRTSKTLPIIIAGHPTISKWFVRFLFGMAPSFPDEDIILEHHYMGDQPITVNLKECMDWLVKEADKEAMEQDRLFQFLIDDMSKIAEAEVPVDIFDKSTWGDHDFTSTFEAYWNYIAPKPCHTQRGENLVQTAKFVGKTHVDEARRTGRSMIHCTFIRDFKLWAFDRLRKKEMEKPVHKRRTITKVEGKPRLMMTSMWIDRTLDRIDAAKESLGPAKMKAIIAGVKSKSNKSSASDSDKKEKLFLRATKSKKKRIIEVVDLADVTPWMNGSIILSYLTTTNNAKEFILAELDERRVKLTNNQRTKLQARELHPFLVDSEIERKRKEENIYIKEAKEVKTIKPKSNKMKQFLPIQWEIYKKRKGLV